MDMNKAETPEDEKEISLNETSLKKPLSPIDIIGGHGPWQFRQWMVFLMATLCNATVAFTALFLPTQTYCFPENFRGIRVEKSSNMQSNTTASLSQMKGYAKDNALPVVPESICNSTDCKSNMNVSAIASAKLLYEFECWNSQGEIFVRCIYIVAFILSCVLLYLTVGRFGKRPLALVSCLFLVASSFATSWADTSAIFLILRFIISLGIFNIYLISAFSLMEYVHNDFKFLYFFTGHLGWGMAHFLLPTVAWLARDWMSFNIILSICGMILSFFVWWGPETPSSFPKKSEITRCRKSLKYAAFINGYSTTDVDLLSNNFRTRQESKHDLGRLSSTKAKISCFVYSFFIFAISFTTSFIYFATKWHPEWFRMDGSRISFAFLGTTEVASTVILLFLTSVVAVKYLWACVAMMSSALMVVIFIRKNDGTSRSSRLLFTVTVFFATASWTLLLARSFCHRISNSILRFNLALTALAVFAGSLAASAVVLKAEQQEMLLVLAIPHFIFAIATVILPENYFGTVS